MVIKQDSSVPLSTGEYFWGNLEVQMEQKFNHSAVHEHYAVSSVIKLGTQI